jgi:serine/threonine protein kinase
MSEPTSRTEPIHQPALPPGTRMGEIEFHGVLGAGGFGIVYDATDLALGRRVAVKEYMPAFLAGRTSDGQITLLSQSNRTTFEAGLRSFIDEARLLAGLDHASLVKVFHFWKANGTAYFVMPFYDGHTLTHHRRHLHTRFGELRLRELLDGMLGALEVLHARKIVHRDVAPDNILLVEGTRPVLLDFGSARRTIEGQTATFTAVIKQGYAPIEQYDDTRSGIQGPWTDLYALGGTLYFLMTGRPPPPAQTRALTDDMPPLARQGVDGVSTEFLRIVDWMLQLRPQERPQSVRQVREALDSVDGDDKTISTMHVDVDVEPPPPACRMRA